MKRLYIIGGCNGAGKTTASYTILPEILDCKEFVNADEIAKGLSPFQPDKANIEAGKLMLAKIKKLLKQEHNFAFESTLSSRIFMNLVKEAQKKGYNVTILFFWLSSPDLAVFRVKNRVKEGGHNIPEDVILRRYERGLYNFFNLYLPVVNNWFLINNSGAPYEVIAEGFDHEIVVGNKNIWQTLKRKYEK